MGLETALIGSAAIGAAGGMFGADQARHEGQRHRRRVRKAAKRQLANLEQGLGEQERLLLRANREELQGGEEAITRFEQAGAQAIKDETGRAVGAGRGALSSRGLLGSSVEGNLRLGAGRAASRDFMSLGEAVSGLRQSLAARRAAGSMRLGALRAYRATARNEILGQEVALAGGLSANSSTQPLDLSGFGNALGLYAALGSGGGGGAFTPEQTGTFAAAQAGAQATQASIAALFGGGV